MERNSLKFRNLETIKRMIYFKGIEIHATIDIVILRIKVKYFEFPQENLNTSSTIS